MKKITLAFFAMVCFFGKVHSQANYVIEAPQNNNSTSSFRAPNGSVGHTYQRTVFFIHEVELLPMNLSTINSFSFQYTQGTGSIPVTGNFTVMMQNSTDNEYLKGTSFSAAVAPMTTVYVGPYTVPGTAGASTVGVQLTTPFAYNGGGLYIAYDWESTGPFSAGTATYLCNNQQVWCATADASVATVPNTLGGSNFRPALIFNATNNATNELEVFELTADGKVSKLLNTPQTITARVVNSSIGAQSNVSVALNVSGANTYNNIQVLPTLAAGQVTTVTFTGYNPTNNGLSTMSVAILALDDNINNNLVSQTQSVTCNEIAKHPDLSAGSYTSQAYGAGASASGLIYTYRFTAATNCSATAVRLVIPGFANAQNNGKQIYAVLQDAGGNIIGAGNPVTINGTMLNVFSSVSFSAPAAMTAGNDYNIGIAIPTNSYFPIGVTDFSNPFASQAGYFSSPITGGAFTPINVGHLSLEGVLTFPSTEILASASKTAVCKTSPQQVTITATGADTYTWSLAGAGSGSTAVFTPTAPGNNTTAQITVVGGYSTGIAAGCKSNNTQILFSLLACTGINENVGADAVRIFPNPTVSGKTTVTNLSGLNTVSVYNTLGQIVLTKNTTNDTEEIDISSFPSGNYLVKITDSKAESRTIKVINQN